jgi:CheY-like chemotaxis protein
MSGLLLETELDAEQRDYASVVSSSAEALLGIINDILDFSKIEAGRLELEEAPFDLRACLEAVMDTIGPLAAKKQLDLVYDMEEGTPEAIVSDMTRLRQILLNLLNNAVKFTEDGEVSLTVRRGAAAGELLFTLRDTGIGIPADKIEQLFESFSQADASTSRRYGGTGLGLAISKRLSELLGGRIWVESEVGKGARFSFVIKAAAGPATARPTLVSRRDRASVGAELQVRGRRILIVIDHAATREALQKQTEAWGFVAEGAMSGPEALTMIGKGRRFDLVILDLQTAEMDGLALAAKIRTTLAPDPPPLILLSPLGRRDADASGMFAASLTKPVRSSRLYDAMIDVLGAESPVRVPIEHPPDPQMAERHPLRILLAEDNPVNQRVAAAMLARLGYHADVVANGVEAVEAVRRVPYDVVFMDLQMPELDGLGAARQIVAEQSAERRPRIVALTANAFEEDRQECLAAGMDDYLSKPLKKGTLEAALARATRLAAPAEE